MELIDFSELDFSGTEGYYAVLGDDGWTCLGVYQYSKEAHVACEEFKEELDDPTCKVYSFSIIANEE